MPDYPDILTLAGYTVEWFKRYGSYQGEWIAKVGEDAFIHGSYGSCSGCDELEDTFDWDDSEEETAKKAQELAKSYENTDQTLEELKQGMEYWDDALQKDIKEGFKNIEPDWEADE